MTNEQRMLELAARCEAATGPDRELDCDIGRALGHIITYEGKLRRFYSAGQLGDIERLAKKSLPKFTASLDAAMMLVPEEWRKYVADDEHGCHASVWDRADPRRNGGCKDAATPALALCAASLRANLQGEG